MENNNKIIKNQTININNRKSIEVVGVLEVLTSTEKQVFAKLEDSYLSITGEKMTILKLVPDEKLLVVSGVINGLSYQDKYNKKSFLKKVFK